MGRPRSTRWAVAGFTSAVVAGITARAIIAPVGAVAAAGCHHTGAAAFTLARARRRCWAAGRPELRAEVLP
jgi:hypothetical protein